MAVIQIICNYINETVFVLPLANANDHLPIVFFDRVMESLPFSKITTNDRESSCLATRHLAERGCKNIVYLSISKALSINNQRIKGFSAALQALDLSFSENSALRENIVLSSELIIRESTG